MMPIIKVMLDFYNLILRQTSRELWRKYLKIRKRIDLTIETENSLTYRVSRGRNQEFCETCDSQTPLLIVSEMAQSTGMSSRTIFQMIGAGQLHFRETATGSLLVCFDSLSTEKEKQLSRKEKKQ